MKSICPTDLESLYRQAVESEKQRSRILLHDSPADRIQEMCIGLLRASRIPPHRQLGRGKSYLLLQGRLLVEFYRDDGTVAETVALAAQGGQEPFILRFDASRWHTVKAVSDWVVYVETIAGPHDDSTTEWMAMKRADQIPGPEKGPSFNG